MNENIATKIEENEEISIPGLTQKVLPFRIITGGKDGGEPWLTTLPEGVIFLCRPKQMNVYVLSQFEIVAKSEKATFLYNSYEGRPPIPVDAVRFSNAFDLVEILGQVIKEKEEEHDSDRTD